MRSLLSSLALAFVAACEPSTLDVSPDASSPGGDAIIEPGEPGDPKPTLGEPVEIEPDQYGQWVWIDMPAMRCSNGTAGGFAVNFTTDSRELVIYLQGGGICYDALTCAVGGAATSVGNDPLRTAIETPIREGSGIFDRGDTNNPFRESNFVVLPHCTGDHHTGNRVATYGDSTFHHVGYTNITRMLERIVPTFPDATRVVLSGFSAGGVGITANYHQLATAFASVGRPAPYLVIDAGPFMRPPFLATAAQASLRESWGLDGTVGSYCPTCVTTGFHDLYRVNGELHPGMRSSLLCSYNDSVVRLLYGVLNRSGFGSAQMRQGLDDLADWGEETLGTTSPHRVFFFGGTRHGTLQVGPLTNTPGLVAFLEGQLGTGDWPSVRP